MVSEGAILEVKRYETEEQTFLTISIVHSNDKIDQRFGIIFEGLTDNEIAIHQIEVSLLARQIIDKRLVVLSPETYDKITSTQNSTDLVHFFSNVGLGLL